MLAASCQGELASAEFRLVPISAAAQAAFIKSETVHGLQQFRAIFDICSEEAASSVEPDVCCLRHLAHALHRFDYGLCAARLFFNRGVDLVRDLVEATGSLGDLRGAM